MKKAFTLIELMVSLIIGLILINFAFSYQFNLSNELEKIKSNENLAMHSFKLSEILARGFVDDGDDIEGLVCLSSYTNNKKIRTYAFHDIELSITMENGNTVAKINDYTYPYINTQNLKYNSVKDMDGNNGNDNGWIYEIELFVRNNNNDIINGKTYLKYSRLVYTK